MMRPLAILIAACALLWGGVLLWFVARGGAPAAAAAPVGPRKAVAAPAAADRELGGLSTRVAALESELEAVRGELSTLRAERRAVEVPASDDPAGAPAGAFLIDFSQRERAAVLDIVAAERERIAAERDARAEERARQRLRARAQRVAERAGLAAGQDEALVALWMEERRREKALRADFRAAGYTPESRERLRERQRELADWLDAALEQGFGQETAADIAKALRRDDRGDGDAREDGHRSRERSGRRGGSG